MVKPAAFKAAFSDLKLVKTRQIAQLIFEIPLADFDAAYEVLGGLPNPAEEKWVAIAALKSADEPLRQISKRTAWADLLPQQQAGMRCEEPIFGAFLKEQYPADWRESGEDAAECVRLICAVASRAELSTNHKARVVWNQLNEHYEGWKALEHA